jgi:hypothetical protein
MPDMPRQRCGDCRHAPDYPLRSVIVMSIDRVNISGRTWHYTCGARYDVRPCWTRVDDDTTNHLVDTTLCEAPLRQYPDVPSCPDYELTRRPNRFERILGDALV